MDIQQQDSTHQTLLIQINYVWITITQMPSTRAKALLHMSALIWKIGTTFKSLRLVTGTHQQQTLSNSSAKFFSSSSRQILFRDPQSM